MQKRRLGRTNFEIGVVGFGGIPIQQVEKEQANRLIHIAKEQGINFIDTARGYTVSEERIGSGIQGHKREDWIIATKSMARDYAAMKQDIETSLDNLRCGYIDLYQLHLVRTQEQYDQIMGENGAYRALKEAKEAGKIKEIGITSHDVGILEMAVETDYFSTIQFPYNAIEQQGEKLFKRAYERNIGVIVMKPLAGGALQNGNLALRFILENPHVSVVIPGMDDERQVINNSEVGQNFTPLKQEERDLLKKVSEELGATFCRRCGYCVATCPQEIDIPTQFLLEGYFTRYELQDWSKIRYASLPKKASHCIKCGKCEQHCPYDLPIRQMLDKVVSHLG